MPSTYAHRRFGTNVLEHLPDELRAQLEQNRELYDIGLHGPDLLFYYHAAKSNPVGALGNAMHEVPAPRTPIFFFVTFVSSVSAPRKGHCALCGEFAPVPGQARCALLCSLYTKAGAPSTACRIAQSFPDGSSVFVHITRFEQTVCTPSGFML